MKGRGDIIMRKSKAAMTATRGTGVASDANMKGSDATITKRADSKVAMATRAPEMEREDSVETMMASREDTLKEASRAATEMRVVEMEKGDNVEMMMTNKEDILKEARVGSLKVVNKAASREVTRREANPEGLTRMDPVVHSSPTALGAETTVALMVGTTTGLLTKAVAPHQAHQEGSTAAHRADHTAEAADPTTTTARLNMRSSTAPLTTRPCIKMPLEI